MNDTNGKENLPGSIPNISESIAIENPINDYKKQKTPRKILHFCDGTLEEYSTDEEDTAPKIESMVIDTKTLNWRGWFGHWAKHTGKAALDTCDSVGGSLANFFGITSPKYFYEIEEYNRMIKEDADEKMRIDGEMAGWSSTNEQGVPNQEIYKISRGPDLPLNEISPQKNNSCRDAY